jgi:hypothetical protein
LRTFDQREEDVEFRGTEIDQCVRWRSQLSSGHVKAPARKLENATRTRRRSGRRHGGAPQNGANAGEQFARSKRFSLNNSLGDFGLGVKVGRTRA